MSCNTVLILVFSLLFCADATTTRKSSADVASFARKFSINNPKDSWSRTSLQTKSMVVDPSGKADSLAEEELELLNKIATETSSVQAELDVLVGCRPIEEAGSPDDCQDADLASHGVGMAPGGTCKWYEDSSCGSVSSIDNDPTSATFGCTTTLGTHAVCRFCGFQATTQGNGIPVPGGVSLSSPYNDCPSGTGTGTGTASAGTGTGTDTGTGMQYGVDYYTTLVPVTTIYTSMAVVAVEAAPEPPTTVVTTLGTTLAPSAVTPVLAEALPAVDEGAADNEGDQTIDDEGQ